MHAVLPRYTLLAAALALASSAAGASGVITQINDGATPGDFVYGVANIGWKWTAPTSFTWDGLGSTFKTCCQFNVLSPSQATLLIATDTPAKGGTTLRNSAVDGARPRRLCRHQSHGVQQQPFSVPILRFEGMAAAVPEPAAVLLMAAGVATLLLRARRAGTTRGLSRAGPG